MNIWYIKKEILTRKQKIIKILKDILIAITIPTSIIVINKLYLFYYDKKHTLSFIIAISILIFTLAIIITNKIFNKKRSNHVFIKDKDNRLIYCYLYHNGFNNYSQQKFYIETLNMEENLKENTNKKSIFYDIATTKENYSEYGQVINKIYSIEEYRDFYEIYLSNPKNKVLVEAIPLQKNITNIDSLLEELNKIKSLDN